MGNLTSISVRNAKPGKHSDGRGLFLFVTDTGAKSWVVRVQVDGRRREYGLGSAALVTLAEARDKATDVRKQAKAGLDPVYEREKARRTIPVFREAAKECHESKKGGWRNDKHRAQWISTLEAYAFPKIGSRRVDLIDAPAIVEVLAPIWLKKPETARRIRQRIAVVLDYAHAKKWRAVETPTRSVSALLPDRKLEPNHFAAMPFKDVPAFLERVRGAPATVGRMALEFTILTAARSGETRGATWDEMNLDEAKWTIPAARMKMRKPHIVPLSGAALAVLERIKPLSAGRKDGLVFPGNRGQLSDMTLTKQLRDWGLPFTVHGFRSSFRDWAAEKTGFAHEVCEMALAHAISSKVEAAYRRGDLLEKRTELMSQWAAFLAGAPRGNVVAIRA